MLKSLIFRCLAGLVWLLASSAFAVDIYVDNDNGAPGYTETGTWTTTSNVGSGWNGGVYRFTAGSGTPSTATWTPTIPTDGFYQVIAIFRRGADRGSNIAMTTNHADGAANTTIDQTGVFAGDLEEATLGTFRFLAGTSGNVVMNNAGANGVCIADTILFRTEPPPTISNVTHFPLYPTATDDININAIVTSSAAVATVQLVWSAPPSGNGATTDAFDDGAHNDGAAGDGKYGATIPAQADGEVVSYHIEATDTYGAPAATADVQITVGAAGTWDLVINEVVASNDGNAFDPDLDDDSDWIEIYNNGPDTADLTGIALSDNPLSPTKWLFPAGSSLAANQYLLVWCDSQNFSALAHHTNFGLSASGESAVLYDTITATVLDTTTFPAPGPGESWARIPNLTGAFQPTIIPSPAAENLLGTRGAPPMFSVSTGIFNTPFAVTITAAGSTEIRYTMDGSEPTPTSTVYTTPVQINGTNSLRARAYYAAVDPSLITSAFYFFDQPSDRQIPTISLVLDPAEFADIYAQFDERGRAFEKAAHVSVISPDGSMVDESDAGLRIHGGFSREAAKKSFRLYFRNTYGNPAWSLPWLSRTELPGFSQLVLRAAGNDGFLVTDTNELNQVTYIRDQLMRDWFAEQGEFAADGFFAALYVNGQYWGLYNATERISDDTMEAAFGGDSWDIIKGSWTFETKFFTEATDGDLTAWNDFLAWHNASDLSMAADFNSLKTRIDYPNFLNWMALNIVCQNEDWPHNNWIASHRRDDPSALFTFNQWDSEWGLGLRPQGWNSNTLVWAQGANYENSPSHNGYIAPLSKLLNGSDLNRTGPNPVVNGILDNPQGLRDFVAAVEDFLNFEFEADHAISEFDSYAALIASEIPREAARWEGPSIYSAAQLTTNWPIASENLRNFIRNRPAVIRGLIQSTFSIPGTRTITFERAGTGAGGLSVNGHKVDLPWTGTFFDGSATNLVALPAGDAEFMGFSGGITSSELELDYQQTTGTAQTVTLTFGLASSGDTLSPNDVIINEYWVNDNPTTYTLAAIEGDWVELLVVKNGADLRGVRISDNATVTQQGSVDDGDGSVIFPAIDELASVPSGTIILMVLDVNATNTASFPADDIDSSDFQMVFYTGNENLDVTTDPGFGIGTGDAWVALVAPGAAASFVDDTGIDFIAENAVATPDTFFGADSGVVFQNPFSGIGGDDGAVFLNGPGGGWNNDNGADADRTDFQPGPGGWIVDPPSEFTGDSDPIQENYLTPGFPNRGQSIAGLLPSPAESTWVLY